MTETSQTPRRVIAFDSGLGGLTVVRAIRELLPDVGIVYLADNALFPYGALDEETLIARVPALVVKACEAYGADAIVIACNTASTAVLDALRRQVEVPVVGVVPAIKPAGEQSRSRVIGLLATEGTVRRAYVDDLVRQFAADCRVIRVGSQELVRIAEDHMRGVPPDPDAIHDILTPFFDGPPPHADAIVLGCTHFPLVLEALKAAAPPDVIWLDPAPAIARRLGDVLSDGTGRSGDAPDSASESASDIALFTADPVDGEALLNYLTLLKFSAVSLWKGAPEAAIPKPRGDHAAP